MDFWGRIGRIKGEVVARKVAGEDLLIPIRGRLADMQRIFALDPVAAYIWSQLDGSRSLEVILRGVLESFDVTESRARKDMESLVRQLEENGLIECEADPVLRPSHDS